MLGPSLALLIADGKSPLGTRQQVFHLECACAEVLVNMLLSYPELTTIVTMGVVLLAFAAASAVFPVIVSRLLAAFSAFGRVRPVDSFSGESG